MLFVLYALNIWGKKLEVVSAAAAAPITDISKSWDTAICPSRGTNITILALELLLKLCYTLDKLYNQADIFRAIMQLKDLVDGTVAGSGSDFIVIQKGRKRLLLECQGFKIKELKSATTPYGSHID
jgi:hypothetical protein